MRKNTMINKHIKKSVRWERRIFPKWRIKEKKGPVARKSPVGKKPTSKKNIVRKIVKSGIRLVAYSLL